MPRRKTPTRRGAVGAGLVRALGRHGGKVLAVLGVALMALAILDLAGVTAVGSARLLVIGGAALLVLVLFTWSGIAAALGVHPSQKARRSPTRGRGSRRAARVPRTRHPIALYALVAALSAGLGLILGRIA